MTDITYTHTLTPGQIEDVSDIQDNFDDASDVVNGSLDTDNFAASAGILDVQRASPNNAVWRPVFRVGGSWRSGGDTFGSTRIMKENSALIDHDNEDNHKCPVWHPSPADVNVPGKSTQVRLTADMTVNATAPGVPFTVGLRTVTVNGGAVSGQTSVQLGISNIASVAFASPAASSVLRSEGSAVTLPAAAAYVLTVTIGGLFPSASVVGFSAELQMRHI